jgi:hypothetical protein
MAKCRMATLPLPTLSRSACFQSCAMTKLVVMAQHPAVRRGCVMVVHTQTGARRLPNVWLEFFLLVVGSPFDHGKQRQSRRHGNLFRRSTHTSMPQMWLQINRSQQIYFFFVFMMRRSRGIGLLTRDMSRSC